MTKVNINLRKSLLSEEFIKQARLFMVQWKNAGGTKTKNIKNILLPMPVLRTCRQHGGIAKRTKTARLRRNTQPIYQPKTQWQSPMGKGTSCPNLNIFGFLSCKYTYAHDKNPKNIRKDFVC